jgi:hypothetical protein
VPSSTSYAVVKRFGGLLPTAQASLRQECQGSAMAATSPA